MSKKTTGLLVGLGILGIAILIILPHIPWQTIQDSLPNAPGFVIVWSIVGGFILFGTIIAFLRAAARDKGERWFKVLLVVASITIIPPLVVAYWSDLQRLLPVEVRNLGFWGKFALVIITAVAIWGIRHAGSGSKWATRFVVLAAFVVGLSWAAFGPNTPKVGIATQAAITDTAMVILTGKSGGGGTTVTKAMLSCGSKVGHWISDEPVRIETIDNCPFTPRRQTSGPDLIIWANGDKNTVFTWKAGGPDPHFQQYTQYIEVKLKRRGGSKVYTQFDYK